MPLLIFHLSKFKLARQARNEMNVVSTTRGKLNPSTPRKYSMVKFSLAIQSTRSTSCSVP
jgi:hypothetical protein